MNTKYLLYTDYLRVTFEYATATNLSNMFNIDISNYRFMHFLPTVSTHQKTCNNRLNRLFARWNLTILFKKKLWVEENDLTPGTTIKKILVI
ncbi:MAG: hypothetical protein D3924_00785 [Candidatus Electrothrix sp. AR4]|nr:hypothetical protein [Candidatus Electrothrix sp. AR4]